MDRRRRVCNDRSATGLVEGLAFGTLIALAIAASGTDAEFIHFRF